jgi:hypothetical protein
MIHPFEGTPFVSSECTVAQEGYIPDLNSACFELIYDPDEDGAGIWGVFKVCDEKGELIHVVQTDDMTLQPGSPLDQKLQRVIDNDDGVVRWIANTDNLFAQRIGAAFGDRVARCHCHDIKDDGECWALGRRAVRKIITQGLGDLK